MRRLLVGLLVSMTISLPTAAANLKEGDMAPDFTLKSNGAYNLRLSDQKGHIMVIVFWASWCRSCPLQLTSLNSLQNKYAPYGVKVWGISLDKNILDAKHYVEHKGLNFTALYDHEYIVSENYDINDLPASLIVDRDGVIRHYQDGYEPTDTAKYDEILQKLVLE